MKQKKYLTISETSELTGINESTLRKRIKKGKIEGIIHTGRCGVLIPASIIETMSYPSIKRNNLCRISDPNARKAIITEMKKQAVEELLSEDN